VARLVVGQVAVHAVTCGQGKATSRSAARSTDA
jgi:hypothetical protein